MKERDPQVLNGFFYEEEGTNEVTEQIMNAYNSGVVGEPEQNNDHPEGQTDL